MKKKALILIAGVAVAAIGSAIFLLRGGKDSYLNALPADATALARMDTRAFLDEAELSLQDFLQLFHRSQDGGKVETGLDVTRPIYGFTSPSGNIGLVAAVSDEDDLLSFCESLQTQGNAREVTSQRGYSWVVVEQQWLMAFDSKKAMLMGPAVGAAQEQLRGEMARLLEQDKADSGVKSTLYAELKKAEEPLAAVVAPEILPAQAREFLHTFKVSSQSDALLLLELDVEQNELRLEAEVLARSEDVRQELKRLNEMLRPIKGSLLNHTSAEHVMWMGLNVEGGTLLSALRSNNSLRTSLIALNLIFDLDKMIAAVDGDVALELSAAEGPGMDPFLADDDLFVNVLSLLQLYAQVNNTDFLSGASSWGNMFTEVRTHSPQDFSLLLGDRNIYFGVQDDVFYLGNKQGLTESSNDYLRRERGDIKGSRFFATFCLPEVARRLGTPNPLPDVFKDLERLNVKMEKAGELEFEIIAPAGTQIIRDVLRKVKIFTP